MATKSKKTPYKVSPKLLAIFFGLVIIGLLELYLINVKLADSASDDSKASRSGYSYDKPAPKAPDTQSSSFKKSKYSTDEPSSLWVVVNKGRKLPSTYDPGLRSQAAAAMKMMFADAANDGIKLQLLSGYRSYSTQVRTYNGWVSTLGKTEADRQSARPGHSEHQTGLAADLGQVGGSCNLDPCFGDTPTGEWLAKNAHNYGFIIRYRAGKEGLTGYAYEPWHIRFVGKALAAELFKTGQTMEEFFGLPIYKAYPNSIIQL